MEKITQLIMENACWIPFLLWFVGAGVLVLFATISNRNIRR